jgi:hypothetical protein
MTTKSKPAWLQVLATLILTGCAAGIGMGLSATIQPMPVSPAAALMAGLAAPLGLVIAIGLWRSGRQAAWWFLAVTASVYVVAGAVSGAFGPRAWSPVIPIMAVSPLLYPAAGLVWGGLLHQAATQGYLAFVGRGVEGGRT